MGAGGFLVRRLMRYGGPVLVGWLNRRYVKSHALSDAAKASVVAYNDHFRVDFQQNWIGYQAYFSFRF